MKSNEIYNPTMKKFQVVLYSIREFELRCVDNYSSMIKMIGLKVL